MANLTFALLALGLTSVTLVLARRAEASASAVDFCHGPRIVVPVTLAQRWRDAAEDARVRLNAKSNLDRCAELSLEPDGDNLRLQVSLADGRSAVREIANPAALYRTLEALVSVPSSDPRPASDAHEPAMSRPEILANRSPATSNLKPHLEVGIGGMGRVATAPIYGGVGLVAFTQLDLDRWIFGVSARWDAIDTLVTDASPSGFNMQTLALGIDIGVRSTFRGFTLDTLVGPEVRIENQEAFGGETAPDGIGGGTSDVRLDVSLRLATQPSSAVRFFTEGDVDASPARLAKTRRLDPGLPTLPAWSAGIALGVSWSLP